ncbi:PH domain-containing protein [Amycolatopsis rhabdoformis]|uniref:PH domain-containing protein n=1 Tax=Amycolatopsis rhabdoformis TaxID=1448059 RepID=A0ABZ1IFN1_9PSEU|nr:PH domain-containing protein [Amycolatopsis rhabdoformis]WSE33222.1 PH domain-containing protein [Amycolatopsis rhabdoformis]
MGLVLFGAISLAVGLGLVKVAGEDLWGGVWLVLGTWFLALAVLVGVDLDETGLTEQGLFRRKRIRWDQVKSVKLGVVGKAPDGRPHYGPILKLHDGTRLLIKSLGAPLDPADIAGSPQEQATDTIASYLDAGRNPRAD